MKSLTQTKHEVNNQTIPLFNEGFFYANFINNLTGAVEV